MSYVIKRYSNRKLYDTQESRYVTLEEIEELIRGGKEISVVDVATGEDLTSVTLAQIILENERSRRAALPTAFLHQLIKHGEAWQDFTMKSFKTTLESINSTQRDADRVFREWASRAGWLPASSGGGSGSGGGTGVAAATERKTERATERTEDPEALRGEIATLREQLRTLEERLEKRREK